jgi:hypothetical protein
MSSDERREAVRTMSREEFDAAIRQTAHDAKAAYLTAQDQAVIERLQAETQRRLADGTASFREVRAELLRRGIDPSFADEVAQASIAARSRR